jgi:hypothetical protein
LAYKSPHKVTVAFITLQRNDRRRAEGTYNGRTFRATEMQDRPSQPRRWKLDGNGWSRSARVAVGKAINKARRENTACIIAEL